jgi:hypothetical protein
MYIPTDTTIPAPTSGINLTIADLTSPYYYIYNLTQWSYMINSALSLCYLGGTIGSTAILGLRPQVITAGLSSALISANAPFMDYNPVALTFTLNADVGSATVSGFSTSQTGGTAVIGSTTQAVPTKIFFNTPLAELIATFPYIYNGVGTTTNTDQQVVVYNNLGTNLFTLNSPYSYTAVQVYQEGTTASLFNPIQSLIFQSTLLPIVMEQVGVPKITSGGSGVTYTTGNNSNINPIITDFIVPFSALNRYTPDVEYTPSGEYRLVDLYGATPISNINLQVFWKDCFGQQHPLYLSSGRSASVKLMFRRKDFNTAHLFQ